MNFKQNEDVSVKNTHSKFQKHMRVLVWKCYLQRQRRWRILVVEMVIAFVLFVIATLIAKPVFLTPIEEEPEAPLSYSDITATLHKDTILGFAPNIAPYKMIMEKAADVLGTEILAAKNEYELDLMLYNRSKGAYIIKRVIWILWTPRKDNIYKVEIKSTEVASYSDPDPGEGRLYNPHLRAGFLAVQLAVSQSLLEHVSPNQPDYDISLMAMPVSPLMEEKTVRRAVLLIFVCFTLAFLPPVLETEAIVVGETTRRFKRAICIRGVKYTSIYFSWLLFAFLTAAPICLLGSITLILIFRWIHLISAFFTLLIYECIMVMLALIMAMFHTRARVAWVWSTMQTMLQTFLAELMVSHAYNTVHPLLTFILHMFLPPLGLLNGLNQFALLQTSQRSSDNNSINVLYTIASWMLLIFIYFQILLLLQRTLGAQRAIGGQVSWKTVLFKKPTDANKLRPIQVPTGAKQEYVQEVDDLVAKAISFRDVTKSEMDVKLLVNLTFDIYRGEFTFLISERIQAKMLYTIEDLIIGLTMPDSGTINVLGVDLCPERNLMTERLMMGYFDSTSILIKELTVEEHLNMFIEICLWNESSDSVWEYEYIRTEQLMKECDLEDVRHQRVVRLGAYYKAQLCWAIAILLEPKIVILPHIKERTFEESPVYKAVVMDKAVMYNKFMTLVKFAPASNNLEFADRVFLLDTKVLAFGGTPAYMFFRYGREYRFRLNLKVGANKEDTKQLLQAVELAGGSVRAHLGSLLLLKMPTNPSKLVTKLVKHIERNAEKFGVISLNISLPDTEEIFRRALAKSRAKMPLSQEAQERSQNALLKLAEPKIWQPELSTLCSFSHLRVVAWKYFTFYVHYRFFFIIAVVSALLTGIFIGLIIAALYRQDLIMSSHVFNTKVVTGEALTVEALDDQTILVLHLPNDTITRRLAEGYVMSQTFANNASVAKMKYIAFLDSKSLKEYLVTRAIDSPQDYVNLYAYGLEIGLHSENGFELQALYSPMHKDSGAAARSLARAYMALMRYYTRELNATVEFVDNPLVLDLFPFAQKSFARAPLLIQFLLVLTISHITLLPSKEYGLIRHVQKHALNFSPARYWLCLALCDFIFYWLLTAIMTVFAWLILFLTIYEYHALSSDFWTLPLVLLVYGFGSIPQGYLFSLGPRATLNSMAFIVVNVVFGEATVIARLIHGKAYTYAINAMYLSPQFNTAFAFMKIVETLFANSECILFRLKKVCVKKMLHKCCSKCGVLQKCFERRSFILYILPELIATISSAALFMIILLLWEYRQIQRFWALLMRTIYDYSSETEASESHAESMGAQREKQDVLAKMEQIKHRQKSQSTGLVDTFGEYLLAVNISKAMNGSYKVRNVHLGVGRGETLALAGLTRHGRLMLCHMLAGYRRNTAGETWCMSRYRHSAQDHTFCKHIAIMCDESPLPHWMAVYDALEMIALLRGMPRKYVKEEVENILDALDLFYQADLLICRLQPNELKRLGFAAAALAAPPVLIFEECTAYQNATVKRAMYEMIYHLKKQGHAVIHSAANLESHMPVSHRLAIIRDGEIFDIDYVDNMLERYQNKGYTVVVHLKDEVNIERMFGRYFKNFTINDTTDVLVNVQVFDDLNWSDIFGTMEMLLQENQQVYSYIVCATPMDYIYNSIVYNERGKEEVKDLFMRKCFKKLNTPKQRVQPPNETLMNLRRFKPRYDITMLKELPWSVIFHR